MEFEPLECLNHIVAGTRRYELMHALSFLDSGPKGGTSVKEGCLNGHGCLAGLPARIHFVFSEDTQLRLVIISVTDVANSGSRELVRMFQKVVGAVERLQGLDGVSFMRLDRSGPVTGPAGREFRYRWSILKVPVSAVGIYAVDNSSLQLSLGYEAGETTAPHPSLEDLFVYDTPS